MSKGYDLGLQLRAILDTYSDEVSEIVFEEIDNTAKEMTRELRQTSNEGATGQFKKGWHKTVVQNTHLNTEVVVHNRQFSLVHLLEHGHLIQNGTGRTKGSTRAFNIVERAENNHLPELEQRIIRRLEGL